MLAGGADERAAALVYSLTMTLMGISFGGMWLYITRRPEVVAVARLTPAEVNSRTRRFVIGAPLYALSIGLALVSAPACLAMNAFLALYYAVPSGGSMAHITEKADATASAVPVRHEHPPLCRDGQSRG
jgi:uncharacterized iron-regulated membrane protein